MQSEDEWRPVFDRGSEFLVARDGRVKVPARIAGGQAKAEKLLSPHLNQAGYQLVTQKRGDAKRKHYVHRLVGYAFVPGYFEGASINHMNGNKIDNRAENLEWLTLADNTVHQWRTGLIERGDRHHATKLRDAEVAEVRRRLAAGHRVVTLAKEFSVSTALIYKIGQGRRRATVPG